MCLEASHEVLEVGLVGLPVAIQQAHAEVLHDVTERRNAPACEKIEWVIPDGALHNGREVALAVEHLQEVVAEEPVELRLMVLNINAAVILRLLQLVHIASEDHLEIGDEEPQKAQVNSLAVRKVINVHH